jgi:hypothetical protein
MNDRRTRVHNIQERDSGLLYFLIGAVETEPLGPVSKVLQFP